jgi:dihydroorotate dehydrogenase (fumarate)
VNLSTTYMGLRLPHPFMAGASPLGNDLDMVKRLEDAGAAAIVLSSLFEEQIRGQQLEGFIGGDRATASKLEALHFAPRKEAFARGPEAYLAHLARIKAAVRVPVIGSLNGTTLGGWLEYARAMEQAGADALELNVYALSADLNADSRTIEDRTVEMVRAVRAHVHIPLAVKLLPFYTALAPFARRLGRAGVDGLVLFNRFYPPDLDWDGGGVTSPLTPAASGELPLRLHWLALLSGRVEPALAVSGGVADGADAVRALLCGAHVVQMVSALMERGPGHLGRVLADTSCWMQAHNFDSIDEMRGRMSLKDCPDACGYERAGYLLALQSRNARQR